MAARTNPDAHDRLLSNTTLHPVLDLLRLLGHREKDVQPRPAERRHEPQQTAQHPRCTRLIYITRPLVTYRPRQPRLHRAGLGAPQEDDDAERVRPFAHHRVSGRILPPACGGSLPNKGVRAMSLGQNLDSRF